ncbi:hypothetical protein FIBSPDRAFT_766177 [Athelia psychrophila]|uniref:Uncharacterized protein n=1 Tax=Athelia psychrophila TaxID=1759441 RepID=A0A167VPF1_9AGAM|nr:hypothetical protein FIBSPDRAFT_766177 [Fibularhizoctonia sp. CBS 109695]
MFDFCAIFIWLSVLLGAQASLVRSSGKIVAPAPNSIIMPGQPFKFSYISHADYSISSYNYTVWLSTKAPSSFTSSGDLFSGHYFGRFSEANYPGNPNPSNPPPSLLVMPDFAKGSGGFGAGKTASNVRLHFAVLEEWSDGSPTLGNKFSLHHNPIVYNASSHADLI